MEHVGEGFREDMSTSATEERQREPCGRRARGNSAALRDRGGTDDLN